MSEDRGEFYGAYSVLDVDALGEEFFDAMESRAGGQEAPKYWVK
jgi:hypothetical protein